MRRKLKSLSTERRNIKPHIRYIKHLHQAEKFEVPGWIIWKDKVLHAIKQPLLLTGERGSRDALQFIDVVA